MTWEIAFVLGLTIVAVVLFVTEKFSTDVVAVLVMVVLLVSGILTHVSYTHLTLPTICSV